MHVIYVSLCFLSLCTFMHVYMYMYICLLCVYVHILAEVKCMQMPEIRSQFNMSECSQLVRLCVCFITCMHVIYVYVCGCLCTFIYYIYACMHVYVYIYMCLLCVYVHILAEVKGMQMPEIRSQFNMSEC